MTSYSTTGSTLLDYSKAHLFGIRLAFVELADYQNMIERFLENEMLQHQQTFNKEEFKEVAKSYYPVEDQYYNFLEEQYLERHAELAELYPHNFRASFLIDIISFIEYELKSICEHCHKIFKTDFSVLDLSGSSDIERAKKFLIKACKVSFAHLNTEWEFINSCRELRNLIVHDQGVLKASNHRGKVLKQFIEAHAFLKIRSEVDSVKIRRLANQVIISTRELNDTLLRKAENFFEKLLIEELKLSDKLG